MSWLLLLIQAALYLVAVLSTMLIGGYLLARFFLIDRFDYLKEVFGLKEKPIYKPSKQFRAWEKRNQQRLDAKQLDT